MKETDELTLDPSIHPITTSYEGEALEKAKQQLSGLYADFVRADAHTINQSPRHTVFLLSLINSLPPSNAQKYLRYAFGLMSAWATTTMLIEDEITHVALYDREWLISFLREHQLFKVFQDYGITLYGFILDNDIQLAIDMRKLKSFVLRYIKEAMQEFGKEE